MEKIWLRRLLGAATRRLIFFIIMLVPILATAQDLMKFTVTVNQVIASPRAYSGKPVKLLCDPVFVHSTGSLDCESGNGTYLSIDRQTIDQKSYRQALDRCVGKGCQSCLSGTVGMDGNQPVLKNVNLIFVWGGTGVCLDPSAPLPRAKLPDVSRPSNDYSNDLGMRVERDPRNPNIIYVDRVAITDAEGYQLVGNRTLAQIRNSALSLGRPDPTAGIPKKPGRDYNY